MKAISNSGSVLLPNGHTARGRRAGSLLSKKTFTTSLVARHLKITRATSRAGLMSLLALNAIVFAIIFPIYNIMGTNDAEAVAGTPIDSTITFNATRSTASVDLMVTDTNGTFASSTAANQAAFSLSTTNYTGYTLTIASNTNTSALTNTNGGSLSSISSPIDESTFNTTTYNNKWGYKPNYYNSAANSNYLQSPTTTASTLDETSTANSTAKNYTIALGARADYTNASGTYSSSNYKLMYVANPVAYSISFDKGSASENPSNMPAVVTGSVSALSVNLPNTVPTRTAYDFTGWCLGAITTTDNVDTCSNANVYNPNGNGTNLAFGIDRESDNTGVTLHAMWSIKTYTLTIINNGNANVSGSGTYQYGETVTLNATPNTNTTCTSYSTPTWSKTSGEGTLNSTSGTSVTFTMGAGNAAITVSSTASDIPQTITLSRITGASGITIAGTNYTGPSVSLNCGTYNISGNYNSNYEFSSWEAANGVAVASASSASTTITVSGAGALTLNAKSSKLWFQIATSADCGKTMYDNRGNDTYKNIAYTTAKIGSLCWMTRNLDLPGGTTLTPDDTNLTTGFTLPASSASGFGSYNTDYVYNSSSTYNDTSCGNNDPCYSYYSFYTATAHWGTSSVTSGSSSVDICPKGWRLPTHAEYNSLAYNNTGAKLVASPFYSVYSGLYDNGSFYSGGSYGYYWSSTAVLSNYAFGLYFDSSSAGNTNSSKYYGFAVRCVMKPTMQDATASSLATLMPNTGDTATLIDSRDGKGYSVAKLADGKYWMTSNLDLTGGITLTSSDTNITDTYDLPSSSSSPNFGSETAATVYNSGSTDCSADMGCYSYYSYLAATAGTGASVSTNGYNASGSICPKGWRLPTATTSNASPTSGTNYKTGDFWQMATQYGMSTSNYYENPDNSPTFYSLAGPGTTPNFLLSGRFNGTSFRDGGSYGYYWSSTARSSSSAYYLNFNSGYVSSADFSTRRYGSAVRCIYAG